MIDWGTLLGKPLALLRNPADPYWSMQNDATTQEELRRQKYGTVLKGIHGWDHLFDREGPEQLGGTNYNFEEPATATSQFPSWLSEGWNLKQKYPLDWTKILSDQSHKNVIDRRGEPHRAEVVNRAMPPGGRRVYTLEDL